MNAKQTLVVIGNGMVGQHFLDSLINSEVKDDFDIVTFCEEPRPAYDRVHLSEYFNGKSADDLSLVKEGFFEQQGIKIHLGDRAVKIDQQRQLVHSAQGLEVRYDKVVLATGSYPFVPPIPGHEREQCLVYRTIEDLEAITAHAKNARVGVVVGGGVGPGSRQGVNGPRAADPCGGICAPFDGGATG
nr:FAD-dependent oxidoreductase [Methylomarinum sp. Ch1-1]MDP4522433.1 FAD-dependent oxidoreductase [Methylomarinum sp. Ch1-1]